MKQRRIVFVVLSLLVLLVPLSATAYSGVWKVTDESPLTINGITTKIVGYYSGTVTLNISAGSDTESVVFKIAELPTSKTVFLDGKHVTLGVERAYVVDSLVVAEITIIEDDGQIIVFVKDLDGNPLNATIGYWNTADQMWYDHQNHSELRIGMRDSGNVTKIRAYAPGYFTMEREIATPKYPPETYFMFLVPLGYVPPPPNVPGFPWECWFRR
jgi:hypothetical protein